MNQVLALLFSRKLGKKKISVPEMEDMLNFFFSFESEFFQKSVLWLYQFVSVQFSQESH